jgi:hypothetical protein
MAASKALPPCCSISNPASVAKGWALAIAACLVSEAELVEHIKTNKKLK